MDKELNNLIKKTFGSEAVYKEVVDDTIHNMEDDKYIVYDKDAILESISDAGINKILVFTYKKRGKSKEKIKGEDNINDLIESLDENPIADILLKNENFIWMYEPKNRTLHISEDGKQEEFRKFKSRFLLTAQKSLDEVLDNNNRIKEENRREKEFIKKCNKERAIAAKCGIYCMTDKISRQKFEFWRICTQAGGYMAGQLITLAYTTNAPSYPLILTFYNEMSQLLDVFDKEEPHDVLFMSSTNNPYHVNEVYKKMRFKKYSNNLLFDIHNSKDIILTIQKYQPKIIFIDNFQQLDGSQSKNSELLLKICRDYKVCCFLLYELNNTNPKRRPDITKLGTRSGILDKSDKIYIFWTIYSHWENETFPSGDSRVISVELVKNRQSKLTSEYLFFDDDYMGVKIPPDNEYNEILSYISEDEEQGENWYLDGLEGEIESIKNSIEQAAKRIEDDMPYRVIRGGLII